MSVPAAYLGVILIWSTTPLAIQWSSEGGGFLFGVTARMVIGAVAALVLVTVLRIAFPWHRRARRAYAISGFGIYAGMLLVYWGAQFITSGLVSVLYGLLPLITSVMAALFFGAASLDGVRLSGMGLALAGLVVIFDPVAGFDGTTLAGITAVLGSAVVHALSMLGVQRHSHDLPALATTTGGLVVAAPLYLLTWAVTGQTLPQGLPAQTVGAILYLGLAGSVLGFMLFYYTLKHLPADAIALVTLITPVCALLIGHLFNGEPLEPGLLFGSALVLGGLAVHHWGRRLVAVLT